MNPYDGFYARFETPSKKEGSLMMGADDLVGNPYSISMEVQDGRMVAWISNKFGAKRAFLDEEASQKIQLALARDWEVRALLSFVAYTDAPEPGYYWGQVAVFCFEPSAAQPVEAFIQRVGKRLAEGVRPKIDLGPEAIRKMLDSSDWMPSETVPLPKKEVGMAVLKDHQSMGDKMVEQGRARNKGCYVVSWLFILVIVAFLVYMGFMLFDVL